VKQLLFYILHKQILFQNGRAILFYESADFSIKKFNTKYEP